MGQKPVPPVNIPIPTKNRQKWVVPLPQNGTIGFDPQPYAWTWTLHGWFLQSPLFAACGAPENMTRKQNDAQVVSLRCGLCLRPKNVKAWNKPSFGGTGVYKFIPLG